MQSNYSEKFEKKCTFVLYKTKSTVKIRFCKESERDWEGKLALLDQMIL